MSLKQQNSLVIGGGTGIGLSIARHLAQAGARVAIAGRRAEKIQEAVESDDSPGGLLAHPVDIADRDSVRQLFDWAADQLGPIDILVNSAGVNIKTRTMAEMTPAQWDHVLAVNATGAYNCMYAVLPQMRERGGGLIVNVSSIAGKRATPLGGVAYDASKFAMTALSTAVGIEAAEHGIRVTNIIPGEVETPLLDQRPNPVSAAHRARILQPDDVAPLVVAIALLPPRAHVPELIIKPTSQAYA
jgi:NAD(P)-dependent dehydrogenase (short-subunit alcohol dehydrogenase family)